MRRIMCMVVALMLCLTLALPAFAATDIFVPSISYKDGPELEAATQGGQDVSGCVVVTSIKEAKEKTTDIYQEDRDLLLEIYEELESGAMVLPLESKNYVVRELVDISFMKTGCVEADHGHKEWLAKEDTTIELILDLDLDGIANLEVLAYIDEEWAPIESVKINEDGTLTCVFEDFCPVAFCVEAEAEPGNTGSGDAKTDGLGLWIILLIAAAGTVGALVKNRRKIIG